MAAYTVADTVLSEIQDDIQTAQGNINAPDGYIKLRTQNTGSDSAAHPNPSCSFSLTGQTEGNTIEFISGLDTDSNFVVQIDSLGFNGYLIKNHDYLTAKETVKDMNSGYLSVRYYTKDPEANKKSVYADLNADIAAGKDETGEECSLTKDLNITQNTALARDAEQRLNIKHYQGFTIDLNFKIDPNAAFLVDHVIATVDVKYNGTVIYTKSKYIFLQNSDSNTHIKYFCDDSGKPYATMYSDYGKDDLYSNDIVEGDLIFSGTGEWGTFSTGSKGQKMGSLAVGTVIKMDGQYLVVMWTINNYWKSSSSDYDYLINHGEYLKTFPLPDKYSVYKDGTYYYVGQVVQINKAYYLCLSLITKSVPSSDSNSWLLLTPYQAS